MRRHHILIMALALVAGACSAASEAAPGSSTTTSLIVTTTSTSPPSTAVVAPDPPTTAIEVWVPGVTAPLAREAAAAFSADTGIGVEITAVETDVTLDPILADPASGPDVFLGPHTWLSALAAAGIAEPLPARSEVVAGAVDAVTLRGTVLAAPIAVDAIVEFRRVDDLPVAPTAIEGLVAGCPGPDDTPIACLLVSEDSVDAHYPFIAGTGGYVFGPDDYERWDRGDVGVDSAEALAGGLILQQIVDGAGILGNGSTTVEERFAEGDAPLLWGNAGSLAALRRLGASFVVEDLPEIAEAPAPSPLRVTAAWVNAFSPGKDAAIEFVTRYLGAPDHSEPIAVALGLAPVDIGFQDDPDLIPFIAAARAGHPVPTIFETDFAWERLAEAFGDIRDGDDASAALIDAAAEIRNAPSAPAPAEDEG